MVFDTTIKHRVFVNSMPKSGTFLLVRAVSLTGYKDFSKNLSVFRKGLSKIGLYMPVSFAYENIYKNIRYKLSRFQKVQSHVSIGVISPLNVPAALCRDWLKKIPEGYFFAGHVPYTETFQRIIEELDFKHIIIIRDPRDVLISMAHYIATPTHSLSNTLGRASFNERIEFLMTGGSTGGRVILSFEKAFLSILKWKNAGNCLMIRFEDIVGEKGGGSKILAMESLKKIAEYLDSPLDKEQLDYISNSVFNVSSPTFRKGRIGSWRDEFPSRLLKTFNEKMGSVISELGYEY